MNDEMLLEATWKFHQDPLLIIVVSSWASGVRILQTPREPLRSCSSISSCINIPAPHVHMAVRTTISVSLAFALYPPATIHDREASK